MSDEADYTYDVFISYSHADGEWVRGQLLPRLEGLRLKAIIDYRDFEPGAPLVTEIERALLQSRKTVLVLTPSYLDSEWAKFENILLQTLDPGARQRRVLPVILQPCVAPLRIRALVSIDLSLPQKFEAEFKRLLSALADHRGSEILRLLESLDPELEGLGTGLDLESEQTARDAYDEARDSISRGDYEEAIEVCQKHLLELEETSPLDLVDLLYAKGLFHLLIASVHLNQGALEEAEKYYTESEEEFHKRQWSHLKSLAYLGLAITQRKLGEFKKAITACASAQNSISNKSVPERVFKTDLREAINRERSEILRRLSTEECREEQEHALPPIESTEKTLPIFNVLAGEGLVTAGRATTLNLLSCKDYENNILDYEKVVIDLTKRPSAKHIDYILEIGKEIKVNDDLEQGVWLPIQEETDPKELNGRTVVVMAKEDGEISVSLKTFVEAEDHYFLKAKSANAVSVVLVHYKSNLSRIRDYYTLYAEENVFGKRVDEVQISGAVHGNRRISQESIEAMTKAFIWRIPIVNHIAAGLGGPNAEVNILDYIHLSETRRRDSDYFVVVVDGDSMAGDGILTGDYALIRRQEKVEKTGDIAAVVIQTAKIEKPLGVLKRYYLYEKPENLQHWFLRSSNPSSKHLVVIPSGADVTAIRALYVRQIQRGMIECYEDAELHIVGQLIKLVEKN